MEERSQRNSQQVYVCLPSLSCSPSLCFYIFLFSRQFMKDVKCKTHPGTFSFQVTPTFDIFFLSPVSTSYSSFFQRYSVKLTRTCTIFNPPQPLPSTPHILTSLPPASPSRNHLYNLFPYLAVHLPSRVRFLVFGYIYGRLDSKCTCIRYSIFNIFASRITYTKLSIIRPQDFDIPVTKQPELHTLSPAHSPIFLPCRSLHKQLDPLDRELCLSLHGLEPPVRNHLVSTLTTPILQ